MGIGWSEFVSANKIIQVRPALTPRRSSVAACLVSWLLGGPASPAANLHLNSLVYFESQDLGILRYQNTFREVFRDQKMGGIEVIQHGARIATGGEVLAEGVSA